MNVTSTVQPPEPPPMVTLTITMDKEEARDFCEIAYSRMPSRYGNLFIVALEAVGIKRSDRRY